MHRRVEGRRPRSRTRDRRGRVAGGLLGLLVLLALVPRLVTSASPTDCRLDRSLDPPSAAHPFGVDLQGCDYLATTLAATRTSLTIAALVLVATTAVALVLGSLAGTFPGWPDALVSRAVDVWAGIPVVLGGVVLLSGTSDRGVPQVALVLAVFGWPAMVRVLRSSVLVTMQRDHVLAARALGAGRWRVLVRHVLPLSVRPLLVFVSAYAGVIVAAEATLTFAGVGLQLPEESWGIQLAQARTRFSTAPHLLVVPAAFLTATVLAFVLLGEALRGRGPGERA